DEAEAQGRCREGREARHGLPHHVTAAFRRKPGPTAPAFYQLIFRRVCRSAFWANPDQMCRCRVLPVLTLYRHWQERFAAGRLGNGTRRCANVLLLAFRRRETCGPTY